MRSKQQPRPSYRWLNKPDENAAAAADENAEESGRQRKESRSRSGSPNSRDSSPSLQHPSSSELLVTTPPTATTSILHNRHQQHSPASLRRRSSTSSSSPAPGGGGSLLPPTLSNATHQRPLQLIDSHDDVEHSIPATLIQDPTAEREMTSPRCQSRESARSPSDESVYSGRGSGGGMNALSPVGLTLPPNIPPALLPQHSAAMAAYLGAAAVAAQQNRLLLGGGRGSPPLLPIPSPLGEGVLDFSKKRGSESSDSGDNNSEAGDAVNLSSKSVDNSPLDLSVGSGRKRASGSPSPVPRKKHGSSVVSPWTSPQLPYFAANAVAPTLSPKQPNSEWNGKHKPPNEAAKALEKMSELSRIGGDDVYRPNSSGGGRHSAWQSHWLNKGADSAKDVLKCVWCKQSFNSLAALTTHMKETKHCGVSVPPPASNPPPSSSTGSKPSSNDLNLLIKETMPLPRKLVRGQDVWLGKGAEQTRQILKCMWCGQSFRTLAEMTTHMQQTQHYTNIISQEQIISWKSSEGGPDKSGSGSESSSAPVNTSSTVSAVLTCKVCDQAFSSLKELSNHMVKNAHYKEHIMRSITESGNRRRTPREKRKKSLPVRKLLELERAQHDFGKNGEVSPVPKQLTSSRITCEKCSEKIEMQVFTEHIRLCVGGVPLKKNLILPPDSVSPVPSSGGRKSEDLASPRSAKSPETPKSGEGGKGSSSSILNSIEALIEKSFDTRTRHTNSFGPSQPTTPLGASILKRLGIDESVDYTKPLVDSQTMSLLKNYHSYPPYSRPRSGSESSSVSERGSSRVDSLTPDKKFTDTSNHVTPRATPDKGGDDEPPQIKREVASDDEEPLKIKKEQQDEDGDRKSSPSPRVSPAESPASARSTPTETKKSSLGALSSMFDSLTGAAAKNNNNEAPKKGNAHPLAALQKLCDKTENSPTSRGSSSSALLPSTRPNQTAGGLLAFSWACNDAITEDAVVKCAYCDTSFNTKGAYRHHLSKVHFVDNSGEEPKVKSEMPESPKSQSSSGNGVAGSSGKESREKSKSPAPGRGTPNTTSSSLDESPHSKFLKYTELAKQLSSKYA